MVAAVTAEGGPRGGGGGGGGARENGAVELAAAGEQMGELVLLGGVAPVFGDYLV